MQLVMTIKKYCVRGRVLSIFLMNILECQLLTVLILPTLNPFFKNLLSYLIKTDNSVRLCIPYAIIHLLICLMVVIRLLVKNKHWLVETLSHIISWILQIYPFIIMVPMLVLNCKAISKPQVNDSQLIIYKVLGILNIMISVILGLFHENTNWSNRFVEKDYCNRLHSSYLLTLLVVGCVIVTELFGTLYGCLCFLFRAIYIVVNRVKYYQFSLVQYIDMFYSLMGLAMVNWVIVIKYIQKSQQTPFQRFIYMVVVSLFISIRSATIFCSYINYQRMLVYPSINQPDRQNDQNSSENKSCLSEQFENNLRIAIKTFTERKKKANKEDNDYSKCWRQFSQRVLVHKITCVKAKCNCKNIEEQQIDSEGNIYIADVVKQISMYEKYDSCKQQRMKLLCIYTFNEIMKKPLKAYYQIMRLKKEKLTNHMIIDLQCLVHETRQCFDIIFRKNKVQNQQLELLKVIEYEQFMSQLEVKIMQIINNIINFLQLFTFASLKITIVEAESKKIAQEKEKIENMLEFMVENYSENQNNMLMVYVFYKFTSMYKSRQSQLRKISHQQLIKKRIYSKSEVNVFSAEHGSIYIDLVEERGKILKLTKNVADVFGYNRQDMVFFNINRFMPKIYGRYHSKFLSNFVEKGQIKLLKGKQRLLFAKNKQKFIFPVNVRLKTEHLYQNQFGASALLTPLPLTTDFIIVGSYGKIQQITQNLYKLIFGNIYKDQVNKITKICTYKMIPSLTTHFQKKQSVMNRIIEGLLIYTHYEDTFNEKFKYMKENASNNNSNSNSSVIQLQTSNISLNTSISSYSYDSLENQQYQSQLFKSFFVDLNIFRLRALTITYKISKLKTQQFQLDLIEITSMKQLTNNQVLYKSILQQYRIAANNLNLLQEENPAARQLKYLQQLCENIHNFEQFSRNKTLKSSQEIFQRNKTLGCQILKEQQIQQEKIKSFNDFTSEKSTYKDQKNNQVQKNNYNNSQQSSVIGNTQTQSKKQILINAFNSKQSGVSWQILFITNFIVILLFAVLISMFVIIYNQSYSLLKQWDDNTFMLQMKQNFQYRTALKHIQQFKNINQIKDLHNLQNTKDTLSKLMVDMLSQINQLTTSQSLTNNLYGYEVKLIDPDYFIVTSYTIPELLNYLLWIFTNQTPRTISILTYNYEIIHKSLQQFIEQQYNKINTNKKSFIIKLNILFGIYEFSLLILGCASIPLYMVFKNKEKFLLGLLSYMSSKQIKKSIIKLKLLKEYMTIEKEKVRMNKIRSELDNKQAKEKQQNNIGLKNIKLVQQFNNRNIIFNPYLLLLLIGFVALFSILSLSLYFTSNNLQDYSTQSLEANHNFYNLQNKPPLLVNIYLNIINSKLNNKPTFQFSDSTYKETTTDYFSIIAKLASNKFGNNFLSQSLHDQITKNICTNFKCDNMTKSTQFYYLVMLLKTKLTFWQPQNNFTMDKISINTWVNNNYINGYLDWIQVILQFSLTVNKYTEFIFKSQVNQTQKIIIISSWILIPLSLIFIILIQVKFFKMLNGILKESQDIYVNFSPNVLVQNTYLTSYFNAKVKQNK